MRAIQSDYMHWAKTQLSVRYNLASSEVPHFRLDKFPIGFEDLQLDGASRYRYPQLREAIAAKAQVAPERVVMADGASMANMLAIAALIRPGDDVLAELPGYEPMVAAARFLGANVRQFVRKGPEFRLDPAAVEAALTPETRLVMLTNLHNPSGNLADEATLIAIGRLASQVRAYVLVDEVYLPTVVPPRQSACHLSLGFVVTSSLTKSFGLSGLRCGWIIASPEIAERCWRLNDLFGVAQAHQAERLSCIALDYLDEIAADTPAHLAANRKLANDFFASRSDLEVTPIVNGLSAFPRLPGGDTYALDARLREHYDTGIVPGRFFGLNDHFRIGVGGPKATVVAGLERLGKALDELK